MRIGHNIRRFREAKGWSQEALALQLGISQSTVSNVESNKQDLAWEQIEQWAYTLEVPPEEITRQDAPTFNSYNQQGGQANNYIVQHTHDPALAAKDEAIAAKNELINLLKAKIAELQGKGAEAKI
jgi:Predicted transcriptional regulators